MLKSVISSTKMALCFVLVVLIACSVYATDMIGHGRGEFFQIAVEKDVKLSTEWNNENVTLRRPLLGVGGKYIAAPEGAQVIEVDPLDSITQTITGLTVGKKYILCFRVCGQEDSMIIDDPDVTETSVKVSVTGSTISHFNSTPVADLTVTAPARNHAFGVGGWSGGYWKQYQLCIVPTATTITIDFSEVTGKARYTSFIDTVTLKCDEDEIPDIPCYPPKYKEGVICWPVPDPKTYAGPLDLIVGEVHGDQDVQVEGNEDQEDEGRGIRKDPGSVTPVFAMVTSLLTAGEAQLRIDVPEWVRVEDSDGIEVDGMVTWDMGTTHDDGNSRHFTVYSDRPICEGWFHLTVVNPGPSNVTLSPTEDSADIYIDCGCSEPSPGSNRMMVDSVSMQADLGTLRYGDSAGYLQLKASEPSADLYTPGALQVFTHNDLIVTGFDQDGGTITAPLYASELWGAAKVTVESPIEYRIAFYESENTMNADTGNTAATAFRVLTVKNPNALPDVDEVYITEKQSHSGVTTRYWHYEYSTSGATDTWVMTEGMLVGAAETPLRVTRRQETTSGAVRTETLGIYEPTHSNFTTGLVYEVEEVYEEFAWGEEMTSRTADPNGLAFKETWTYEDDSNEGDNYRRLIAYESATGYWERYRYTQDMNGMDHRDLTVSQLHNNAVPDFDVEDITVSASNNIASYHVRSNHAPTIGGAAEPVYVEAMQVKVEGVLESSSYKIVREDVVGQTAHDETWLVACTVSDPEAATSATDEEDLIGKILRGEDAEYFVVSRSWYWKFDSTLITDASDPGELYKSLSAEGVLTVFDRAYSFRRRTTVTESGYDPDGDEVIDYGMRSTVVQDPRGNVVSALGERTVVENGWFIESYVERLQEDTFGRPTETGYYFGAEAKTASTGGAGALAFHTLDVHACCGTGSFTSHTDRGGVRTLVNMDALGRRIAVTTGDGSTSMELRTEFGLDAAGNVLTVTRKPLASSAEPDLVTTSTYNVAGQPTSLQDAEGRNAYFTYQRVKIDGAAYNIATDTGHFWWETRLYGHDNSVPVGVSWTDSQGDGVLAFTATTAWDGAAAPTALETLSTEHTRLMAEYKWAGTAGNDRDYTVTTRVYHDLYDYGDSAPLEIGLDDTGADGTNYLTTGVAVADPLGRVLQSTDAAGNISAPIYEDATSRVIGGQAGIDANALKDVAGIYYNEFTGGTAQAPDGARRPFITRAYGVRPGLNDGPLPDGNMDDYDYVEADVDFNIVGGALLDSTVWTKPEHLPWSSSTFNAQGQLIASRTYENGDDTTVLTAAGYEYITGHLIANNGRLELVDRFEVSSGAVQATRLRTDLFYNDAGYQIKTESAGRGLTKIELDDYGRVLRSVTASTEGTNTDIEGTDAFTDDIILTEMIYGYNKASQVIQTTSYDRAHDAPGTVTGLLSAASASRSRVNHSATWFDDNRRLTHTTNYGTNGGAAFTRPAVALAPDTSDDRITTQIQYDAAGYAYLITDNKNVQTRRYYNNLGQVTYVVENYKAAGFTDSDDPATAISRASDVCRITAYGYDFTSTHAAGLRTTMMAFDPAADGNAVDKQGDNQTTLFINTGELASDTRGWVPSNSRVVAVVHADAVGDAASVAAARANAIAEINSGTYGTPGGVHGDFVYSEVYAGGDGHFTTDQRGVVWTNTYTDEGYLDDRVASAATGSGWLAPTGSDLRCEYGYGDAGELLNATAFNNAAGGAANRTSLVAYTYDGFYNTDTETQDHAPAAVGPKAQRLGVIDFDYDTTSAGNIYTNAHRRNTVTYPNGRVIELYFAPGTIDHAISRVTGIDEVLGGSSTAITRYEYMGSGRLVRKDYPTPELRLDFMDEGTEGASGTDGYDESWDRFGRTTRNQWETYDTTTGDGAGVAGSSGANVFLTRHGYDRVSNKLYDQREVYGAYSVTRRFDGMHRMVGQDSGIIELTPGTSDVALDANGHAAVDAFWKVRGRDWELDQVNNPTATDTESSDGRSGVEVNTGNEIQTQTFDATQRIDQTITYFSNPSSSSPSDRDIYTDAVNCTIATDVTVSGGALQINAGTPTAPAIILTGQARGPMPFSTQIQSPSNTGLVGKVFGYKSATDYWVLGINFKLSAPGPGDWEIYHMHDADSSGTIDYTDPLERELIGSYDYSHTNLNQWYTLYARANANSVDIHRTAFDLSDEGGFPSGRYGLYTEVSGAKFNYDRWLSDGRTAQFGAAWETTGNNVLSDFDGSGDGKLMTSGTWHRQQRPILLRGVRAQRFEATFTMQRSGNGTYASGRFIFNYQGPGDYDEIVLWHDTGSPARVPSARSYRDGGSVEDLNEDDDDGEVPTPAAGDTIWYRVVSDGVDVKVFAALNESALDNDQTNDRWCMRTNAQFAFSDGVGQMGFAGGSYTQYWDNITVKTDPDNDADLTDSSTYETPEIVEDFALTSGKIETHFVYDDCGNLTFNGYQRLTYDARNRLVQIENAWWDASAAAGQEVTPGSVVATHQYCPGNRLIVDRRYDAEGLSEVIHRYYVGHCEVESRDGSDQVLSQQVWDSLAPGRYIDSLAQVAHNLNPGIDDDPSAPGTQDLVDTRLYAMQDASFCVMGLATSNGQLVERYEYDAYGQRFVYQSAGSTSGGFAEFAWIDINGDGIISSVELDVILANWGDTVTPYDRAQGDLNGDGTVGSADLSMVTANFGNTGTSANDTMVMAPNDGRSQTMNFGPGAGQSLNDFGFQGLRHDDHTGFVYNRARWYDTRTGRFNNADPHPNIFPDGMSRYAAYHVVRGTFDPSGMADESSRISVFFSELFNPLVGDSRESHEDARQLQAERDAEESRNRDNHNRLGEAYDAAENPRPGYRSEAGDRARELGRDSARMEGEIVDLAGNAAREVGRAALPNPVDIATGAQGMHAAATTPDMTTSERLGLFGGSSFLILMGVADCTIDRVPDPTDAVQRVVREGVEEGIQRAGRRWSPHSGFQRPAADKGDFLGDLGNSDFAISDGAADAMGIPRGSCVPWREGVPDFGSFTVSGPHGMSGTLKVRGLTGNHTADRALIIRNMSAVTGMSSRSVRRWLSDQKVNLHHAGGDTIQIVPASIHRLHHSGAAQQLRGCD